MATPDLRARRRQGYETPRPEVSALVPAGARSILELGCASGALGAAIKQRQEARVVGVELDEGYAREAAGRLDEVVQGNAQEVVQRDLGRFDCIVAADVLEHLVDPWAALEAAVGQLDPGGSVVVSVPNVRSIHMVIEVIGKGRWPREDQGLFDRTHLRWFTLADVRALLEGAGLEIEEVRHSLFFGGWQLRVARVLDRTPLAPFVAGQYILRARKP